MKKILILSRADVIGAGSVAKDLRSFLLSENESEIKIFTRYSSRKSSFIISYHSRYVGRFYEFTRAVKYKLDRIFNKSIDYNYEPLSLNERTGWYKSEKLIKKLKGFSPDIIIVLFMDGFVNFKNIYDLYRAFNPAVYFYPMDMSLMTGGCHYSNECMGFTLDCDNCPIYSGKGSIARSNLLWKNEYLQKMSYKILSASSELYDQLTLSFLFKNATIYNYILPIDSEIFQPKQPADSLNWSTKSKKILIGSQTFGGKRKGGDLIVEILNSLYEKLENKNEQIDVEVLLVGKISDTFSNLIKFRKRSLGRVTLSVLVDIYSISDVFLSASREDSGPMMINQSLMCGTPVISFNVGVARDLVKNFETGFIIEKFDIQDYVSKLLYILRLSDQAREIMKMNCRKFMMNIDRVSIT